MSKDTCPGRASSLDILSKRVFELSFSGLSANTLCTALRVCTWQDAVSVERILCSLSTPKILLLVVLFSAIFTPSLLASFAAADESNREMDVVDEKKGIEGFRHIG